MENKPAIKSTTISGGMSEPTSTNTNTNTSDPAPDLSAFGRLDRTSSGLMTPAQARRQAFDWDVKQSVMINSRTLAPIEGFMENYRSDTGQTLGVVKSSYGNITNDTMICFAEDTGLLVQSAGVIDDGRRVWMQLATGDEFLPGIDPHAKYVWIANSHTGGSSFIVRSTMVRKFCDNQWFSLRKNNRLGGEVTLRHTSNVSARIEGAREIVRAAFDRFGPMEDDIKTLIRHHVTAGEAHKIIQAAIGVKPEGEDSDRKAANWDNRFEAIVDAYQSETCANIHGTAYGAVMSVNEWELKRPGRGNGETEARRVMSGLGHTAKAANLALAMVAR